MTGVTEPTELVCQCKGDQPWHEGGCPLFYRDQVEHREMLGEMVRKEWVRYCIETGDTKPSHIAPWEELSEWDKEADRRIGEAVWNRAIGLTND